MQPKQKRRLALIFLENEVTPLVTVDLNTVVTLTSSFFSNRNFRRVTAFGASILSDSSVNVCRKCVWTDLNLRQKEYHCLLQGGETEEEKKRV